MNISTDRPWSGVVPTGPMLRPADAAAYLGISLPSYYERATKGVVPTPMKIGGRASGVPRPWLDAVIGHAATTAGAR